MTNGSGFTIVEILIVVAILTVLFIYVTTVGANFYNSQLLASERDAVLGYLRAARSAAMDDIDQAGHGFYVGQSQYVVFEGSSYASRTVAYDENFPKSPGVSVSGLGEVDFNAVDGSSNSSGTITLGGALGSANLYINGEGRIGW